MLDGGIYHGQRALMHAVFTAGISVADLSMVMIGVIRMIMAAAGGVSVSGHSIFTARHHLVITAAVGKLATFEIISTVEAQDNVTAVINPESIAHLSDINAILDRILHVTLTLDDSGGVLATFPD